MFSYIKQHIGVFITVLILIKFIAYYTIVDTRNYIELNELVISTSLYGNKKEVFVDRIIHKNFDGGYRVTIRDENGASFCTTGDMAITYRVESKLPASMTLSYWAGGGSCSDSIPDMLIPGEYSIETCYFVKNPWYIYAIKEYCYNEINFKVNDRTG